MECYMQLKYTMYIHSLNWMSIIDIVFLIKCSIILPITCDVVFGISLWISNQIHFKKVHSLGCTLFFEQNTIFFFPPGHFLLLWSSFWLFETKTVCMCDVNREHMDIRILMIQSCTFILNRYFRLVVSIKWLQSWTASMPFLKCILS